MAFYLNEIFTAWYSDEEFDAYLTLNRMFGYYAWVYWLMMACNVGVPQLLWFRNCVATRRHSLSFRC